MSLFTKHNLWSQSLDLADRGQQQHLWAFSLQHPETGLLQTVPRSLENQRSQSSQCDNRHNVTDLVVSSRPSYRKSLLSSLIYRSQTPESRAFSSLRTRRASVTTCSFMSKASAFSIPFLQALQHQQHKGKSEMLSVDATVTSCSPCIVPSMSDHVYIISFPILFPPQILRISGFDSIAQLLSHLLLEQQWCGLVQRGATWCNVVQRGATWCNVVQRGATCLRFLRRFSLRCINIPYHSFSLCGLLPFVSLCHLYLNRSTKDLSAWWICLGCWLGHAFQVSFSPSSEAGPISTSLSCSSDFFFQ